MVDDRGDYATILYGWWLFLMLIYSSHPQLQSTTGTTTTSYVKQAWASVPTAPLANCDFDHCFLVYVHDSTPFFNHVYDDSTSLAHSSMLCCWLLLRKIHGHVCFAAGFSEKIPRKSGHFGPASTVPTQGPLPHPDQGAGSGDGLLREAFCKRRFRSNVKHQQAIAIDSHSWSIMILILALTVRVCLMITVDLNTHFQIDHFHVLWLIQLVCQNYCDHKISCICVTIMCLRYAASRYCIEMMMPYDL